MHAVLSSFLFLKSPNFNWQSSFLQFSSVQFWFFPGCMNQTFKNVETTELNGVPGWWGVTEDDGMWWSEVTEMRSAGECEEGWKRGFIRQMLPQLMCCALACGTRCLLISGAQKKRIYMALVNYKLKSCWSARVPYIQRDGDYQIWTQE